jgi:Zn-dependent peptidase ImmA (M78 family)
MVEAVHSIGGPDSLQFDLRWLDRPGGEYPPGYGSLVVWVAEQLIWGQTNEEGETSGVEWYWDDLLERLAYSWRYLLLEESYPLGLLPSAPQLLRSVLREQRIGLSEEMIDAEDNSIFAFEEMHDLSRSVQGATLPKLILLREGDLMLVGTSLGVERIAFLPAMEALEKLGNKIAERIKNKLDGRTRTILEAWKAKRQISEIDQVGIASGLPKSAIAAITKGEEFRGFWEVTGTQYEPNELMAAARMVGRLVSDDEIRVVLNNIKSAPKVQTPVLDELSSKAIRTLEGSNLKMPHEQGRLLAEWLRGQSDIVANDNLVYPDTILKRWNVSLTEIELSSQNLDALCAWGIKHGPTVLLNRNGRLSHYPTGRRSSLAHEICHLLIDRKGSLPVAEVFGGEVPRHPEQRANAFGAELLLTRNAAFSAYLKLGEIERTLETLAESYKVSFEVAAWQLLNSRAELSSSQRQVLLKHTYRYHAAW